MHDDQEGPGQRRWLERGGRQLARHRLPQSCRTPVAAGHPLLPGNGSVAGWYRSERVDALRDTWLQAPTLAGQRRICGDIQALAWDEVPFLPLGEYKQPTSYRRAITGVLDGTAVFWNVRPA